MQSRLLHEENGQKRFVIILARDEEMQRALGDFVAAHRVTAASFSAIGAFSAATLAYFDWDEKTYRDIELPEQVEVASLLGDVALGVEDKPALHVHCVLGRRDGGAMAGHLRRGTVRPTLEIVLTQNPAHLRQRHDPESGLALIDPSRPD